MPDESPSPFTVPLPVLHRSYKFQPELRRPHLRDIPPQLTLGEMLSLLREFADYYVRLRSKAEDRKTLNSTDGELLTVVIQKYREGFSATEHFDELRTLIRRDYRAEVTVESVTALINDLILASGGSPKVAQAERLTLSQVVSKFGRSVDDSGSPGTKVVGIVIPTAVESRVGRSSGPTVTLRNLLDWAEWRARRPEVVRRSRDIALALLAKQLVPGLNTDLEARFGDLLRPYQGPDPMASPGYDRLRIVALVDERTEITPEVIRCWIGRLAGGLPLPVSQVEGMDLEEAADRLSGQCGVKPSPPEGSASRTQAGPRVLPDGPFEPNGFRYRRKEVLFGKAVLQRRLVWALWDRDKQCLAEGRLVLDAIDEVYGTEENPADSRFRQLFTDTNNSIAKAGVPLAVKYRGGKVWLQPDPV